jgi:xanthine dehydrogenase molybdopterin-binding subunit B
VTDGPQPLAGARLRPLSDASLSGGSARDHTHIVPSGAFRGFGVPQSAIAQEQLYDELALRLKIDPLEFRILNALDAGETTVTGQAF